MNLTLPFRVHTMSCWLIIFGFLLPTTGHANHIEVSKDARTSRPLIEVLDDFGERYQVFFSYEASLLEEINVDFEFRKAEPVNLDKQI